MKVLIRTDGGIQIGNGHIIRMQALATEFVVRKIEFTFALKQDDFWISTLTKAGFPAFKLLSESKNDLFNLIKDQGYTHLVYDTRNDLTPDDLKFFKKELAIKVIVIDSPEDVRLTADVAIYPPIPQVNEWRWDGFEGRIYSGWEYVLLRSEFSVNTSARAQSNKILLSFGSTDPFLLTEWALNEIDLNRELFNGFDFTLMVGPQFNRLEKIKQLPSFNKLKVNVIQSPDNITEVFQSVDFAFIALGVTAYELAAMSVPFMYVSISEDHARSGEAFERKGLGYPLGIINKDLDHFQKKVGNFINQFDLINKNVQSFKLNTTICDWSKIINAIVS